MDGWQTEDEGILLRLEPDSSCENDDGGVIWIMMDGFGEIAASWQDDESVEEGVTCSRTHEIEDGSFVTIQEEQFPSGRTNYDREIEFDDLEPLAEEELPDEDMIRELLRSYLLDRPGN